MILTVISDANLSTTKKQKAFKNGDVWARWYQPSNTYNTYSAYIYIFMTPGALKVNEGFFSLYYVCLHTFSWNRGVLKSSFNSRYYDLVNIGKGEIVVLFI